MLTERVLLQMNIHAYLLVALLLFVLLVLLLLLKVDLRLVKLEDDLGIMA